MNTDLTVLCAAALTIGFVHTVTGPDHYIPFVAMSRAGNWSLAKTLLITLLCGLGHVGSSVALGFVGVGFGLVVSRLEAFEALRGGLAGWLLLVFGLAYFAWGTWRALCNRPHTHLHFQHDGSLGAHAHPHEGAHQHAEPVVRMTPWILLTIFVFGPCEPLIPLLMYPAAQASMAGVASVAGLFTLATIGTMLSIVALLHAGAGALRFQGFQRYSHALAGLVVLWCGVAIKCGL